MAIPEATLRSSWNFGIQKYYLVTDCSGSSAQWNFGGGLVGGVATNLAPASHGRMMEQLAQEICRTQQHNIRL